MIGLRNAKNQEEEKAVLARQRELENSLTPEEKEAKRIQLINDINKIIGAVDADIEELRAERIREKMGQLDKAISFSYIAKNYFGKSQSWLMQRLNGSKVNGKEARFNRAEVLQLQDAIHDLGHKLSSLTLL